MKYLEASSWRLDDLRVTAAKKWVLSTERVKISSTNVKLETIVPQKEETSQVVIDIIKNFTCFKAFTISADVPEIFMQQFWYTVKKVKESESYEFLLANKKCIVDAEVFRKILDICPRVEGEEFTPVQDDDDTPTFLIDLGYKVRNDKLRKSRIDKLWGMFYIENVNYLELIWEDFAFQIDHMKETKSRYETMPFPRFTKVIINHFLKQHKSLSNLKYQHYHTIKDDDIVSRLKFVRIGEDYQEYGLAIPDEMLNDTIIQSESYQMFLKYSTSQIPPKKSRGKGSQGKKTTNNPVANVDVSEESKPEPAKKRLASRRMVKKKVIISADDNIIPNPDVALELGKSIIITEAEEEEAARQVHATHARIVTEFVPKPVKKKTGSRSTRSLVIQDTPKQEAADVMQALKESKKTSNRQPGIGGSSEGTGRILRVPDESIVVSATSSEGTGTKPEVPDEEKVSTEEKVILEWGSEQESEYSKEDLCKEEEIDWINSEDDDEKKDDTDDDKSINLEMTNDEETDDEVLQGKEQVSDDEDEEMTNANVEESRNDDEEDTNTAKADAEKTEEAKYDSKKAELPPTSSSLSVSLGFGDQFLKLSSDTSLIGTVKDTTDAEISLLLDIKIQSEHLIQLYLLYLSPPFHLHLYKTTAPIHSPPIITDAPTITTTVPESDALSVVKLRVVKLEKDVSELKKIDHSAKALATLKSQVPMVVEQYLGSKIESKKSASVILKIKKEHDEKQKMPKYTIKSTDKEALKKYDQKSALYQAMHEIKSFNKNPNNHRLYHALMEALIKDENAMGKGVADTVKDHKRKNDDDDDPLAGPNQGKKTKKRRTKESESSKKPSTTKETPKGKAPSKGSKTGKSASAKEPVEEPIAEVVMDDASEDVVHDDDQSQDTFEPKTPKTPNP
ncbi:hypothetical protein Tco_0543203 [Tanacetum coccineum]